MRRLMRTGRCEYKYRDPDTDEIVQLSFHRSYNIRQAIRMCYHLDCSLYSDKMTFLRFLLEEIIKRHLFGLEMNNYSLKGKFYHYFHKNTDFILNPDTTYQDFLNKYPLANPAIEDIMNTLSYSTSSLLTLNYITEQFLKLVNISDYLIDYIKSNFYFRGKFKTLEEEEEYLIAIGSITIEE